MDRLKKSLEIGSNVAIIVIAMVFLGLVGVKYFSTPVSNAPERVEGIRSGAVIPNGDVIWSGSDRNLVMILSTACKYCAESIPFYQKLSAYRVGKDVRLVALFIQPKQETQKYLLEQNITVDEVAQINPEQINIRATPTLLLVDRHGLVLEVWKGKLSVEVEREVMSKVFDTPNVSG
ncbi:MAG: hypothetical protein IPO41_08445 [Acidobacteria bacterium]|nr:hypothetical protein [Acidobacteriota bacterium]MBK9528336.1 hypothetical protein [Acidobacteriota bacterium]MBP7475048.1 hypothetical protein [Pyrinomonadaceae bacterium]MBP9109367.1 hypothetical protein [Pyrinomonadaceae bacterium]